MVSSYAVISSPLLQAFPHAGSRDYGYKRRHCKTFMAVADAKQRFIIVEAGASGRRSDANIFYTSTFYQKLLNKSLNLPPPCPLPDESECLPFFFLGDNAYPNLENFATPFKGDNLRDEEMVYNYRLSRGRRVVENAFGIMCARFRILFRPIEGSPALVNAIILACLALHNYHLQDEESVPPRKRRYRPPHYADYIREDGTYVYGRWRNEDPSKEKGIFKSLVHAVRNPSNKSYRTLKGKELVEMLLKHFIFLSVPWQWESANLLL